MTIFIHGYNADKEGPNSAAHQFDIWDNFAPHAYRWHWQSIPLGKNRFFRLFRAWATGALHTYWWAYRRADKEVAAEVIEWLQAGGEKQWVVCHSLGSRVAYEVARQVPELVIGVLAFNGADSAKHARKCAEAAPDVAFHSVMYRKDKTLKYLGQVFTPALGMENVVGLQRIENPPPNFNQFEMPEADMVGIPSHDTFRVEKYWTRWKGLLS